MRKSRIEGSPASARAPIARGCSRSVAFSSIRTGVAAAWRALLAGGRSARAQARER
jgi:hypothetical protein